MRITLRFVEPVVGVVLFLAWLLTSAQPVVGGVALRTENVTNIYAIAMAAGLAAAIALSRLSPVSSVSIAAGVLVLQLCFWPPRFTQTSWTAYGMLLVLVVVLAMHASGRVRRAAVFLAAPAAVVVGALLALPGFSLPGTFGIVTGKPWESADTWITFALCTLIPLGVSVLLWRRTTRARDQLSPRAATPTPQLEALSARERDIYLWVAAGMTNAEIASEAHIEESTVKTHVTAILSKLGLTSRTAIVAHAYRTGVLAPEVAPVTP